MDFSAPEDKFLNSRRWIFGHSGALGLHAGHEVIGEDGNEWAPKAFRMIHRCSLSKPARRGARLALRRAASRQ